MSEQFNFVPSREVSRIRGRLDHPVVDGDGHLLEFMPLVFDLVREIADDGVARRLADDMRQAPSARSGFLPVRVFFGLPERNTLDRMTVALPELLYRRLDEIGLDFALLYPSAGLTMLGNPDAELRQAAARALNTYFAEAYAGYRDRLEPVAVIPTFTPEEAVAELDYAVGTLGLKAVVMTGVIPRSVRADGTPAAWVDTLGHGSLYDYDPVWAKCLALGVVPAFHGIGYGWGSRVSATNYVHNHLGSFAAAQEAVCRSLIMGGVMRRFPDLRVFLLEGGIGWAAQLYADLLSHYEKRNRDSVRMFDPAELDVELRNQLFEAFARGRTAKRGHRIEAAHTFRQAAAQPGGIDGIDDFAESLIAGPEDIVDIFTRQLSFGCEADDPLNALAFDARWLPHQARLSAMFASDIGHWDVPDLRDVLPEAWELVEGGHLTLDDFREFTFGNVVRTLTSANPTFFDGTAVPAATPAG